MPQESDYRAQLEQPGEVPRNSRCCLLQGAVDLGQDRRQTAPMRGAQTGCCAGVYKTGRQHCNASLRLRRRRWGRAGTARDCSHCAIRVGSKELERGPGRAGEGMPENTQLGARVGLRGQGHVGSTQGGGARRSRSERCSLGRRRGRTSVVVERAQQLEEGRRALRWTGDWGGECLSWKRPLGVPTGAGPVLARRRLEDRRSACFRAAAHR